MNLQDMRKEREKLNSDVQSLQSQLEGTQNKLDFDQNALRNKEREIHQLTSCLTDRQRESKKLEKDMGKTVMSRDEELSHLRGKMKEWQESIQLKDGLINK